MTTESLQPEDVQPEFSQEEIDDVDALLDELASKEMGVDRAMDIVRDKVGKCTFAPRYFEGLYTFLFHVTDASGKPLSAMVLKATGQIDVGDAPQAELFYADENEEEQDENTNL